MNIKSHVLHQIAANYIVGQNLNVEIKGNEEQKKCFKNLLETSRELKIMLDTQVSINEVTNLINKKKKLTEEFQNLTGITWKL
tara:strand:- start:650 stop:898 length:249 start_codon:yes stop_codon:yes gene_type:complete